MERRPVLSDMTFWLIPSGVSRYFSRFRRTDPIPDDHGPVSGRFCIFIVREDLAIKKAPGVKLYFGPASRIDYSLRTIY